MDTVVKCMNCRSSFVNRQWWRKHHLKCHPVGNSESKAEDKVMQNSVQYIEYIVLLGNILVYLQDIHHVVK